MDRGSGRNAGSDSVVNTDGQPEVNRNANRCCQLAKSVRATRKPPKSWQRDQDGHRLALTRRIGHRFGILRDSDHRSGQPGQPGSQRSCPRQVSLRESILETGSWSETTTAGSATSGRDRYENRLVVQPVRPIAARHQDGGRRMRPAKEKRGKASRKVSGSERSQTSEGINPMDAVEMEQARQAGQARRGEGVRATDEPWAC